MKKIAWSAWLGQLKLGLVRFAPFHLCATAVAALWVLADRNVVGATWALNVARGLYWGAVAGVFCRLLGEWRESAALKVAAWGATLVVGALGCWFWLTIGEGSPRYSFVVLLYGGSMVALVASCVALLYRYTDAKTLVARLTFSLLGVSGVVGLFILSEMLCLLAYDKLVCTFNGCIYGDVAMFTWLACTPVGYLTFLPGRERPQEDDSQRAAEYVFWILLPASLVLLAILYIYLGRIAINGVMPSGELNWFGSVALAVYVFFWLALRDAKQRFFQLFVRWGWAFLLPVLAAQIVGIVIRYNAYGLSTPRFAGMITLSFGVYTLVLAAFRRRPTSLFAYIALAGLVFTVTPLNVLDVPYRQQEARLRGALARKGNQGLSPRDAEIVSGAWRYLTGRSTCVLVWYHSPFVEELKAKGDLLQELGINDAPTQSSSRTSCCAPKDDSTRCIAFADFYDRLEGAWLGQSIGVSYGAPTEFKWKGTLIPEDKLPVWKPEQINETFNQDDLYVEMTFLETLDKRGIYVKSKEAGIDFANTTYRLWCANHHARNNIRKGIAAPMSSHPALHPTTDDIDYQIEADFSGILAPGLPQAPVDFGETFGRIMNYGDGLYAGQFVGALYAEAYFETNRRAIVSKALQAIPAASKYAGMVRNMLAWHAAAPTDWRGAWRKAVDAYYVSTQYVGRVSMREIDVKLNGAMVLLGFLFGDGDLEKTMRIATAGGFDSDCNPSTACGVLGTMLGKNRIDKKYYEKLDVTRKWEFTNYDEPTLIATSKRLADKIIKRYGGWVARTETGEQAYVLPLRHVTPSRMADDGILTQAERSQIRYEPTAQQGAASVEK